MSGGAVRLAALPDVPRIPSQHPLQLLGRQASTEPSPRVLLGSLDERPAEVPVQALAAVVIGVILVNAVVIHERRVAA
jgi:hypothetical protein